MPEIHLDAETVERLEGLHRDGEIVTELINIYEAEERTLAHGGDHVSSESLRGSLPLDSDVFGPTPTA
jgi:hypothetical protein